MCIGGAMDENVQIDENVPSLIRKRPRFQATSTKMSYIPIKPCQVQERKRPRFQSARYGNVPIPISKDENVPDSNQQGTKTSQIPIQYVWF